MNIGQASANCGLPAKTIRYYEDIGLILPDRTDNGYRDFSETHMHKLAFLSRARGLGFTIEDCRTLLSLYEDTDRASADVKAMAREHLDKISYKINELKAMQATLSELVDKCHGDDRPNCPILQGLAGGNTTSGC
ncbi:MAG: Cu(I)-responsive transcriptional regulator [Rhodobacteraceae bacterium]|nr:MAG: Cu(I)-responsive transcriptional regulator [Paracoccaceae bacterium]